jgi:hypothetical protein
MLLALRSAVTAATGTDKSLWGPCMLLFGEDSRAKSRCLAIRPGKAKGEKTYALGSERCRRLPGEISADDQSF